MGRKEVSEDLQRTEREVRARAAGHGESALATDVAGTVGLVDVLDMAFGPELRGGMPCVSPDGFIVMRDHHGRLEHGAFLERVPVHREGFVDLPDDVEVHAQPQGFGEDGLQQWQDRQLLDVECALAGLWVRHVGCGNLFPYGFK